MNAASLFGTELARLRFRRKQTEIGALLGVSDSAISNWERGLCQPDAGKLGRLLTVYGADDATRLRLLALAEGEVYDEK